MLMKENLAIVAHLRQNARITLTALSRKVNMPVSTLFDRVRALKALGVTRLTALLDFPQLGYAVCVTLLLKAGKDKRDALGDYLLKAQSVNSLMRVNNGYDFLAECVFKDMRGLEEFCEKLERSFGVRDKEAHFIIDELKREAFLAEVPNE